MNTCGEDDDRTQLDLTGVQPELLDALATNLSGTGKPLIVVLVHGRPVSFVRHNLLPKLPAVLAAWRPGEQGGPAIWEILLGRTNPSGRLSQAWPVSAGFVHSQASPWFSKRQGDFDHEAYRGGPSQQPGKKQTYDWEALFPFVRHTVLISAFVHSYVLRVCLSPGPWPLVHVVQSLYREHVPGARVAAGSGQPAHPQPNRDDEHQRHGRQHRRA